jgi:hypothetical protein
LTDRATKNNKGSSLNGALTAAALAVVALLCFVPESSNDLWLHAAIGRIIWTTGEIPRTALFPFTEASQFPFHAHEWLVSVLLYFLVNHLGIDALVFVKGALGLALFGLCCRLAYRLTGSFAEALLVALAAMVVGNFRFFLRPELFALFFTLAVLWLMIEYRAQRRRPYLLACVPLAALWANCHGSFPLALVVGTIFAGGAALEALRASPGARLRASVHAARPYLLATALMALATSLNPYGLQLYRFVWELQNATFIRSYVYEWLPTFSPLFVESRGFWAFAGYLALSAPLLYAGRKGVTPAGWLLLLAFGYLAIGALRHIAFFAVVSIYPLSSAIAALAPRIDRFVFARGAVLGILVASVGLLIRFGNINAAYPYYVQSHYFSKALVDYLANEQVRGNVLNSYELGAELIYRFYPRLKPAIDSRVDVYGEKYLFDLLRLNSDEPALRQFVNRYQVAYVLQTWRDFNEGIRRMPHIRDDGWHVVFADHEAVLLGRKR